MAETDDSWKSYYCAVVGCNTRPNLTTDKTGIRHHLFKSNPATYVNYYKTLITNFFIAMYFYFSCAKWVQFCQNRKVTDEWLKDKKQFSACFFMVCSKHFAPEDYNVKSKRLLNRAVPTLHGPNLSLERGRGKLPYNDNEYDEDTDTQEIDNDDISKEIKVLEFYDYKKYMRLFPN